MSKIAVHYNIILQDCKINENQNDFDFTSIPIFSYFANGVFNFW